MELLFSLGINKTIFPQFVIFLVTYLFMYFLVFTPYFKAYKRRQENTVGSHEANERVLEDAQDLEMEFASKTREINTEYKKIYSEARAKAMEEYDQVVQKARSEAKSILDTAELNIQSELQSVQLELKNQAEQISTQIKTKVLNS